MAKKLKWGSFTHEDLKVDHEDDIYLDFPFLTLNSMGMDKARNFKTGPNTVRSTKDHVDSKVVGLTGSLFYGWDRGSWPIPCMLMEFKVEDILMDVKEAFDRRHTLKVCTHSEELSKLDVDVPYAEYVRAKPSSGGLFNLFLDNSILTMAAMWGNVFGPIPDDAKDYNFVTACGNIIKSEKERDVYEYPEDLLDRDFIRKMLFYMGCFTRYNNNDKTINRIVTGIIDSIQDPDSVATTRTQNNTLAEFEDFLDNDPEWGQHNTENDDYCFIVVPLQDNDSFCWTYSERILTKTCQNEKKKKNKITKVILFNEGNALNAKRIVASRQKFKKRLNSSWYTRRDNVIGPIPNDILDLKDSFRRSLSDLQLEVWYYNQLETESEPVEMLIDEGGVDEGGE